MSGPWLASTVWEVCHAISQLPLASLPPSSLPPPPAPYFVTVCQCSDTLVDYQPDTMSSFEEQGVQFKVISPDMYEDVMDFLSAHFFPDEPVLRSIGLERLEFIDKNVFPETFNHKCSIAAVDASGKILAVRVGGIKTKGDWPAWVVDKIFQNFPYKLLSRFLPPAMHKMPIFVKLNKKIGFNTWNMMDVWNCRSVFEVTTKNET